MRDTRDWTSSYLLRFQMIILVPFFPIIASSSASNFSSVENKECVKMALRLFLDSIGSLICRKRYVKESNSEWSKLSEDKETSATGLTSQVLIPHLRAPTNLKDLTNYSLPCILQFIWGIHKASQGDFLYWYYHPNFACTHNFSFRNC